MTTSDLRVYAEVVRGAGERVAIEEILDAGSGGPGRTAGTVLDVLTGKMAPPQLMFALDDRSRCAPHGDPLALPSGSRSGLSALGRVMEALPALAERHVAAERERSCYCGKPMSVCLAENGTHCHHPAAAAHMWGD